MLDMGVKPDHFTYATVLDTCANLATIEETDPWSDYQTGNA